MDKRGEKTRVSRKNPDFQHGKERKKRLFINPASYTTT